ncbi:MAG: HD domain-containing protein [Actinobacteria bacterium]|nr:HD domain-containing protein [Actinomycetota bacterium]
MTATAGVVATFIARAGISNMEAFATFALVAMGAELISVRLPNGATASALMVPVIAAVYALGVGGTYWAGALVAAFGGLYLPDLRGARFDRVIFNSAMLLLAGTGAAAVFAVLDPAAHPSVPAFLFATVPAGLVFLGLNVALLVPMLALDQGRPAREFLASLSPFHAQYIPFAIIGTGLGWVYLVTGPLIIPLAVAPVLVARQTFRSYLALRDAHEQTLRTLVRTLERKDPYTAGHVERVATYARYIGEELGLSEIRQERLRYAALMHDVGKLVVSNHLLRKPDRLTAEEYERVRLHEAVSVELLRRIDFLRPIATSASPRYARYDARGPTDPIEPYVIVVADAYDAMTSTRPYRRALPQPVAFSELRRHAGTQFHPACVEALIRALDRREERHGLGHEEQVVVFDTEPPVRGPGSAGLGDLAPNAPPRVPERHA